MRKRINKNLLLGFIAPYILVVLLVFTAQYVSNSVVLNALESNALDIVKNSFESNVAVMEQSLDRVKETAAIVAQNRAIRLDNIDRNSVDVYSKLTHVRKELASYRVGSGVIKDICVQDDIGDFLVTFDVAYSNRIAYYKTMVSSESMSAEEMLKASETAIGFRSEIKCTYDDGVKAIPFVFPTPIMRARTGSVMVYVDEKEMLMPMRDLLDKSGGALEIFDEKGKLVAHDGKKELEFTQDSFDKNDVSKRIGNTNYYIFGKDGDSSKWRYVVLLPENYVLSGVRHYQVLSLVINFLVLLIGFAVCLFFTVRKSRSYLELLETLGIQPEKFSIKNIISKNEYTGLHQHISKIKDENTKLLETGNQNVLRKILNGQIEKSEDIKKELKNHKMEFSASRYAVMVIRHIDRSLPEENLKNFESFIFGEICQVLPEARVCFIEKNITAILLPFNGEDYKQFLNSCISQIESEILVKYHLRTLLGVGSYVTELNEITDSFKQARETVSYNLLMDGQKFYFYSDLPADDDSYYYPLEVENALFKSVREYNFENAREVLQKIQEENFVKRHLSVTAINELLAELRASIKKICSLQTENLEFPQGESSVNHFFEYAISFIYVICSDAEAEKETQSRGQKICREVRNFIELHYGNANLSLEMIAAEFRIHPNYLSSLFKKHTGSNLAPYIESIRIEKAVELLSSGKYTVNEVAASVGFTNDATFRRRFKKIKGVPPSTYLKY